MRAAPPNAGTFAIGAASALSKFGAGGGEDRDAARRATCANAERIEREGARPSRGRDAREGRGGGESARATRVVVRSSAHASREREAAAALAGRGGEGESEGESDEEETQARGNGRREGVGTDSERYGEELEDEEAYLSYGRSETTSVRDLSVSADDDGDDAGYRTP